MLKKIRNHVPLDKQEEFILSRQFLLGQKIEEQREILKNTLHRDISNQMVAKSYNISKEEVDEVLVNAEKAHKRLVDSSSLLIYHSCRQFMKKGISYRELIDEAYHGLDEALRRFDPDRGFRLSTYAVYWIKQVLMKKITCNMSHKASFNDFSLKASIERGKNALINKLGREPTLKEIADEIGLPVTKVESLLHKPAPITVLSGDRREYADNERSISKIETMRSRDEIPEEQMSREENREMALRFIATFMPELEAFVFSMRNGLVDGKKRTLREIARACGSSIERIRQIEYDSYDLVKNYESDYTRKHADRINDFSHQLSPLGLLARKMPPNGFF